ncbi:MAG: hypothetical protein II273_06385 [Lachnospiraceae bacterium]|nr:hypothetical protein [Lachnospiraceae bacterium]
MVMTYDGALVMPSSYAVMEQEEMTYVEGGVSASVKWYGLALDFTSRDLQGLSIALGTGSAASWLAAEFGAPTLYGGITFGMIAAGLATLAGATQLLDWASKNKGITYHVAWNGTGWITVN